MTVKGYTGDTKSQVKVQTLNEYGETLETCAWHDYLKDGAAERTIGWFDKKNKAVKKGAVTVEPGQGFWAYSNDDGYNFEWPGVEIK